MSAEHKDGGGEGKQSKRRTVTSTIRRSLKSEWQALSTPSSPRTSLSLDRDVAGQSATQSQDEGSHQRSGWHRKHTMRKMKKMKKKDEDVSVRSLADLLVDSGAGEGHERKDQSATSWALGWGGKTRRLNAKRMLRKIGGGSENDGAVRHGLARAVEASEYPQSDALATGQNGRERKHKIDAVYKQTMRMARDLGTDAIGRMEAGGFLSLARWDVDTAVRQVHIVLCTRDGILYEINPQIQTSGAVNAGGTSCYIDSLFMALFGAQSSYDALLYVRDLRSESANKLLAISRLFVNFMRAGELIDVWLVEEMRGALFACGWLGGEPPTKATGQQDASELYMFLMDALQMPYLPLEMRMVHGADHDAADCKMVTQRMVELAFPEDSTTADDPPLLLQALLESYFFDNRVEQLERSLKSNAADPGGEPTATKVRTNAWSFLSIYPFYTPQSELDGPGYAGAAAYPDDAPFILPFLLKRYAVDERGVVRRINRRVIIPMVLDVTNIVSMGDADKYADNDKARDAAQPAPTTRAQASSGQAEPSPPPYPSRVQYRLVLRSAVCHKGADVRAGHYISFSTQLRMARPAEIARRRRLHGEKTAAENRKVDESTGPLRSGQLATSLNNIGNVGITRWQTYAHASGRLDIPAASAATPLDVEIGQISTQTTRRRRRHSWPLPSGEDVAEQSLGALLRGDSGSTEASTPAPSLYESQIHGSAVDWENYAMSINPSELKQKQEQEKGRLRNASAEISNEALLGGQPPPPPYPDRYSEQQHRLSCDSGTAACATTTGELLRFDDMDVAHGRVQHFSTGEGGHQCLDEISRDGYLLFYALQRVEIQDGKDDGGAASECESLSDKEAQNPSQAMDELANALRRNERDERARRVIAALMRNSGAMDSSQDHFAHGGDDFEAMAMRWQNIRVDKKASPVGPLLLKRWPDQQSQNSSFVQRHIDENPRGGLSEERTARPPGSRATGDPAEGGGTSDTRQNQKKKAVRQSDQWCLLM